MKKIYICEYPYVLYKVLIKAALNNDEDYLDIVFTNRMEKMTYMIEQIKESKLFNNVYFYDTNSLKLQFDMFLHKFDENITKQRLYELKMWKYFYKLSNTKQLKNIEMKIEFDKYDEIYCTDGAFAIENYLTVNNLKHIMIEHARDVHVKKNYSVLATIFHYIEQILDKYNFLIGVGIASKYCTTMEINSNKGKEQIGFLKNRELRIWNVKQHTEQLSQERRNLILDIYIKSYIKNFNYNQKYNLLLTNPLYIDGDVSSEKEQIQVYNEIIKQNNLIEGYKLLIKPHPRDKINYQSEINSIIIDSMVPSEILCISNKLKLGKVVTLYSSSAQVFIEHAETIIQIAENETEAISFCQKILRQ